MISHQPTASHCHPANCAPVGTSVGNGRTWGQWLWSQRRVTSGTGFGARAKFSVIIKVQENSAFDDSMRLPWLTKELRFPHKNLQVNLGFQEYSSCCYLVIYRWQLGKHRLPQPRQGSCWSVQWRAVSDLEQAPYPRWASPTGNNCV